MGILFAFCAGWLTCARGGRSAEEVVEAAKAVRESEEVAALMAALRQHAGHSLTRLGQQLIDSGDTRPATVIDMLARVRALVQPETGVASE